MSQHVTEMDLWFELREQFKKHGGKTEDLKALLHSPHAGKNIKRFIALGRKKSPQKKAASEAVPV